jgi:hypothetical protein
MQNFNISRLLPAKKNNSSNGTHINGLGNDAKANGNVIAEDASLERFDVAANVRFAFEQMTFVQGVESLLLYFFVNNRANEKNHAELNSNLLIGHDNVGVVRCVHQQRLAKRARALAQHVVRRQWNDGAQSKDERVNILHVQIVGGHCVGHGVVGQLLRLLLSTIWVK